MNDNKTISEMGNWTDDPYVDCPKCGETWFVSDAFEIGPGAICECSNCGVEVECVDEELSRRWCWKMRKHDPRKPD